MRRPLPPPAGRGTPDHTPATAAVSALTPSSSPPTTGAGWSSVWPWRVACALYLVLLATVVVLVDIRAFPWGAQPPYDGVLHFLLLGTAGWLLHRALGRCRWELLGLPLPVGPLAVALVATADEIRQIFVATRTFAVSDLLANLAGVAVFWAVDHWWVQRQAATAES